VFVELAVTTGLLGLATAALWVTLAARGARGALLGFAAIAGLSLLLEPLDLGTTPLLLLAFGVAGRAPPAATFSRGARRAALASGALLALVGVVIGARAIAGDTAYAHAVARYSIADVRRADELSPPWPQFPGLEAQLVNLRGMAQRDPALGRRAVGLARRAVDRDPGDPRWWYLLAAIRSVQGDRAGATRDYQAALRRNPWSASALRGLYEIARRDGDEAAARQYREKLCRIGPMQCPVNVRGSRSRSSGP
jgi:tetratricopeptide (TPR) repeat protein